MGFRTPEIAKVRNKKGNDFDTCQSIKFPVTFNEPLNYLKEHYNDAKKNIVFIFSAGFVLTDFRFYVCFRSDGDFFVTDSATL